MKRLVVVLSSLLVLPAFAEVAPSFYDTDATFSDIEFSDAYADSNVDETVADVANVAKPVTQKSNRNVSSIGNRTVAAGRNATTVKSGTTRNSTPRQASTRTSSVRSRGVSSRTGATPVQTTSISTRRSVSGTSNSVNTSARTASRSGTRARAATVNSTTRLYNANTVQSRGSSGSSVPTVSARGSAMRSATLSNAPTAEQAIETTTALDTIKSLTEYCQAQFASCMDNYCNVLDDNQGRCSCSNNIKNYEKTEIALQNATEALQDVARAIQYIGLPADQITTLFAETEAELEMKNAKDSSAIKSSLDKVKKMIVDVKSGTSSASETNDLMNFDLSGLLNFDMDNTGFDLSSFMNTTTSSNTNSISNQRGETLYKTALARCKSSVLNSCVAQGVDAAMITNSYDLEIDKSCLAYERNLTESNTQMSNTVANAKEVLKKARLMVAQNKNSYDLRGCVSALESCMQDEYVCGSDYSNCLDPTGQYIVNGAVVIGSMPGSNVASDDMSSSYSHDNLFKTWDDNGKNPWTAVGTSNYETLVDYIKNTVKSKVASVSSDKVSAFLQNKIGYHDDKTNKDYGMCMSVLNKCQDYTYDTKGNYDPTNDVIKNFLQRALIQIKASQDELLASYAEDCINDVQSCLTTNNYDTSNPNGSKSRTAINSCYSQIKTCMSVNGNVFGNVQPDELKTWVTGTYSSVETYTSTTDIEDACGLITESTECGTKKGYCLTTSGTTSLIPAGQMCSWNTTTNTCQAVTTATCNESNGTSSSSTGSSGTSTGISGSQSAAASGIGTGE